MTSLFLEVISFGIEYHITRPCSVDFRMLLKFVVVLHADVVYFGCHVCVCVCGVCVCVVCVCGVSFI